MYIYIYIYIYTNSQKFGIIKIFKMFLKSCDPSEFILICDPGSQNQS